MVGEWGARVCFLSSWKLIECGVSNVWLIWRHAIFCWAFQSQAFVHVGSWSGIGENCQLSSVSCYNYDIKYLCRRILACRHTSIFGGVRLNQWSILRFSVHGVSFLRRVSLACALFVSPDILLLDEPTVCECVWVEQKDASLFFSFFVPRGCCAKSFHNRVWTEMKLPHYCRRRNIEGSREILSWTLPHTYTRTWTIALFGRLPFLPSSFYWKVFPSIVVSIVCLLLILHVRSCCIRIILISHRCCGSRSICDRTLRPLSLFPTTGTRIWCLCFASNTHEERWQLMYVARCCSPKAHIPFWAF